MSVNAGMAAVFAVTLGRGSLCIGSRMCPPWDGYDPVTIVINVQVDIVWLIRTEKHVTVLSNINSDAWACITLFGLFFFIQINLTSNGETTFIVEIVGYWAFSLSHPPVYSAFQTFQNFPQHQWCTCTGAISCTYAPHSPDRERATAAILAKQSWTVSLLLVAWLVMFWSLSWVRKERASYSGVKFSFPASQTSSALLGDLITSSHPDRPDRTRQIMFW